MDKNYRYDLNSNKNIITNNGIKSSLASIFSSVKVYIINKTKVKEEIILDKNMKINKDTKVDIVKKVAADEADVYYFFYQNKKININLELYEDFINTFNKIIKDLLPEDIHASSYDKLQSVSIMEMNKEEYKKQYKEVVKGSYGTFDHDIILVKGKKNIDEETLSHEMLHAISSYMNFKDNISYCGFAKTVENDKRIGNGLNEGYTEYLNRKYFSIVESDVYEYETKVASIIEDIIGSKMIEYYFTNDTYSLIEELSKYSSKDEAIRFLLNLDFINSNTDNYSKNISNKAKIEINNYYIEIKKYLLSVYINKTITEKNGLNKELLNKIKYLKGEFYKVKTKSYKVKKLF